MVARDLLSLPFGNLEGEALCFSQVDCQEKEKTENKDGCCLVPAGGEGDFLYPSPEQKQIPLTSQLKKARNTPDSEGAG